MFELQKVLEISNKNNTQYREALREASAIHSSAGVLIVGNSYGRLTLLKGSKKRINGILHSPCLCECGETVYLQAYEVWAREALHEGCATELCGATTLEGKRWLNINLSLKQQWAYYLYTNPFDIDPKWGGNFVREDKVRDERQSVRTFITYTKKLIDHKQGKIWIRKKEQSVPLIEGNLVASSRKPTYMFKHPWQYMSNGEEFFTNGDISAMLGLPIGLVMQNRAKHFFSFDAYCALLSTSL